MKDLYAHYPRPNHTENMRLARLVRQGDLVARKNLIEANAGLAYNNAIRYSSMNDSRRQIEADDLLSAAFTGLIEAVDRFDPEKGYKFVTYAHWWVNKRISEEIKRQHWNTVKPPDGIARKYLYRNMTDDEADAYVATFMQFAELDPESVNKTDEDLYISITILRAAKDSQLSITEEIVFSCMYDPASPNMTVAEVAEESGLPIEVVEDARATALRKIRSTLGIEST